MNQLTEDVRTEGLFATSARTNIEDLNPDSQTHRSHIEATVALIWPYSSSSERLSLLLAENDVRLRRSTGQVKVTFHGKCARAVAETRVGIGAVLHLSLQGVSWTQTNEQVATPGKKLPFELDFSDRVSAEVRRNDEEPVVVDFVARSPSPVHTESIVKLTRPHRNETIDITQTQLSTPQYSHLLKTSKRASLGSFVDASLDPFVEDDGYIVGRGRKRTKFARYSGSWKLVDDREEEAQLVTDLLASSPQTATQDYAESVTEIDTTDLDVLHTEVSSQHGNSDAGDTGSVVDGEKDSGYVDRDAPHVDILSGTLQPQDGTQHMTELQADHQRSVKDDHQIQVLEPASASSGTEQYGQQQADMQSEESAIPLNDQITVSSSSPTQSPLQAAAALEKVKDVTSVFGATAETPDGQMMPPASTFTANSTWSVVSGNRPDHLDLMQPPLALTPILQPVPSPGLALVSPLVQQPGILTGYFPDVLNEIIGTGNGDEPSEMDPGNSGDTDVVQDHQSVPAEDEVAAITSLPIYEPAFPWNSQTTVTNHGQDELQSLSNDGQDSSSSEEPELLNTEAHVGIESHWSSPHPASDDRDSLPEEGSIIADASRLSSDVGKVDLDMLEQRIEQHATSDNDTDEDEVVEVMEDDDMYGSPTKVKESSELVQGVEDQKHPLDKVRAQQDLVVSNAELSVTRHLVSLIDSEGENETLDEIHRMDGSQDRYENEATRLRLKGISDVEAIASQNAEGAGDAPESVLSSEFEKGVPEFDNEVAQSVHSDPSVSEGGDNDESAELEQTENSTIFVSSPPIGPTAMDDLPVYALQESANQLPLTPIGTQQSVLDKTVNTISAVVDDTSYLPPTPNYTQRTAERQIVSFSTTGEYVEQELDNERRGEITDAVSNSRELPAMRLEDKQNVPRRTSQRLIRKAFTSDPIGSEYFTPQRPVRLGGSSPQNHPEETTTTHNAFTSPNLPSKVFDQTIKATVIEELSEDQQGAPRSKDFHRGTTTSLSYFPSLASLDQYFGQLVDVIGVCTNCSTPVEKAKTGPKDCFTTLQITDQSLPDNTTITIQLFRPEEDALAATDRGDVVLLRGMKVQTRDRELQLISTVTSAWANFKATSANIKVTMNGPPVEFGDEETRYCAQLVQWWYSISGKYSEASNPDQDRDEQTVKPSSPLVRRSQRQRRRVTGASDVLIDTDMANIVSSSEAQDQLTPLPASTMHRSASDLPSPTTSTQDATKTTRRRRSARRSESVVHELRDGTKYVDHSDADGSLVHELRDGLTYIDDV